MINLFMQSLFEYYMTINLAIIKNDYFLVASGNTERGNDKNSLEYTI